MITGAIKNNARNGSTLIVTLPCSLYDLRNHLASIGITSEASKLTVGGTENVLRHAAQHGHRRKVSDRGS